MAAVFDHLAEIAYDGGSCPAGTLHHRFDGQALLEEALRLRFCSRRPRRARALARWSDAHGDVALQAVRGAVRVDDSQQRVAMLAQPHFADPADRTKPFQ